MFDRLQQRLVETKGFCPLAGEMECDCLQSKATTLTRAGQSLLRSRGRLFEKFDSPAFAHCTFPQLKAATHPSSLASFIKPPTQFLLFGFSVARAVCCPTLFGPAGVGNKRRLKPVILPRSPANPGTQVLSAAEPNPALTLIPSFCHIADPPIIPSPILDSVAAS
jgi:hypothetical protein